MNGEIIGSVPIPPYKVVLQRFLAIILEIIYLVIWMILFLILSEAVTGATINLGWEIIAIIALIPLYVFLITLAFSLTLLFERRGLIFARVMMVVMLILFIVGIFEDTINATAQTWIKGIFGLYDPILIIRDQSLMANHGYEFFLLGLAIITTGILFVTAKYYNWINVRRDTAFDTISNF